MPRKGGKRKKTRTHVEALAPEGAEGLTGTAKDNIPRSIVARSTKVSPTVSELIHDVRRIMSPYTASNLRERSYNRTKDYASIASQFGITHLLAFSETKNNIILRIARFHNGPTLHFRIPQYCLTKHIRAAQKRPFDSSAAFLTPPLIVLNNFGSEDSEHMKLLRVTLQHMFPSINVNTVRLNECRRVILFHYKKDTQVVEMRHYAIRATPVGINRNIKKILQTKIPNLGNLKDISEFLDSNTGYGGGMSDSEAEDDPTARVELSERFVGHGNGPAQQSAMKLIELGPRMNLELFKVENGMCEGDVLYHKFETKSQKEILATKERIETMKRLKEERRAKQEENVKRKRELQEKKRQEKEERKKRKLEDRDDVDGEDDDEDDDDDEEGEYEENDYPDGEDEEVYSDAEGEEGDGQDEGEEDEEEESGEDEN